MDARKALDRLRERTSAELVERIEHLDRTRTVRAVDAPLEPPDRNAHLDADVVVAGGGLSLLVAAELARLGLRVTVLDRARAGAAHREWNASDDELAVLVEAGIVTTAELDALVVGRYREGICQFYGGPAHRVRGVLDRAVDALPLLTHVRAIAAARGVSFIDHATVSAASAGPHGVRVGWDDDGVRRELTASVLVDARGSASPYATADLLCPTVGGVLTGLQFDPNVGDILVTTDDADADLGRQHVWEGFPGRPGEITVYLFYYGRSASTRDGELARLYARFFDTLPSYKEGEATLLRPTFGFIPGWSRLSPAPRAPSPRIVLVGDAAARHSPLTFCGFGSMLRSFQPAARAIALAIGEGEAPPRNVVPEDPLHAWTGALATVMASGELPGPRLNRLLDAAFGTLAEMGDVDFSNLLKDRMSGRRFTEFLRQTGSRHPPVYREVMKALGPLAAARWGVRLAREVFA